MIPPFTDDVFLSNIDTIPGREIVRVCGLVHGSTIRSKHVGRDIMAGLKNILGGELKSYATLIERARREAVLRMKESAPEADVFFNTRLETSSISKGEHNKQVGCVELLAHATAVRYEKTP